MRSASKNLLSFFSFFLIASAGCAKDSSPPTPDLTPIPNPEAEALLSYEIGDGADPATYMVTFHLNGAKSARYDLYQVTASHKFELLSQLRGPKMDSSVQFPATGERVRFELFESSSDSKELAQTLEVLLPKDLVISGPVDANTFDFSNLSRLYLAGNSIILTNGAGLKIQTQRLIAEKGTVIETFPSNSKALDNQAGKSGGTLQIHARFATGELAVHLRGQNAGKWTTTPPSRENDEVFRGEKGQPGTPAEIVCSSKGVCTCVRQPGVGLIGGDGKPGATGFPGLSGGSSGELSVNVLDGRSFLITYQRQPGLGSEGSIGGIGGPGGFGGKPGANNTFPAKRCNDAQPGPLGKTGIRGPKGEAGRNGQVGQVCLKLSESVGASCM